MARRSYCLFEYSTAGLDEADIEHYKICSDISRVSLDCEKEVYRRLSPNDGIVACLDLSGIGIQMALMPNGNLHDYMAQHRSNILVQST